MSSNPKRHHHLAQTIQRNFFAKGENKLWHYSRESGKFEERTPYGIAHGRHTYTFSSIKGPERYVLEHALSKVEDAAAPALLRLARREEITQAQRNAIAELVGFQLQRTPSKIALIQSLRDAAGEQMLIGLLDHIEAMSADEYSAYAAQHEKTLDQATLVENLRSRPPRIISTKEATLESLVDLGTELAVEFSGRSWVVLHAPRDASFITSSEGVFSSGEHAPNGAAPGPGRRGVISIFPFARRAALLVRGSGPPTIEHTAIDKKAVREINDRLAFVSGEIYGSPRRLLESIVDRNDLANTRFAMEIDPSFVTETFGKLLKGSSPKHTS